MWVLFAFLSAFFTAAIDPIAKRSLKDTDAYTVGWLLLFLSVPFLFVFYILSGPVPISRGLLLTLAATAPFEFMAVAFYFKSLKITDISLAVPFIALTPVFSIPVGYLILGESVKPAGAVGILLMVAGVYSLNLKEAKYGLMNPLTAILLNRGSRLMALTAVIFSVTAVMSKRAMLYSDPAHIPFLYNLFMSLSFLPFMLYRFAKGKSAISSDSRTRLGYIAIGFFSAMSAICFFQAASMTNITYAVSIKRLSLLMSVLYGWIFFRERDVQIRFGSTFCMVLGVALIMLSQ